MVLGDWLSVAQTLRCRQVRKPEEGLMKRQIAVVLGVFLTAILGGCAGDAQQLYMQGPDEQSQAVTFPNGTMFGGASNRQASSLAQMVADSNNNNMKEYGELQE